MEPKKKSYPGVDCFKFICCILIMAIHVKPFQDNFWLDAGVGLITRFAVPYFFVASGFFFFNSINGKKDTGRLLLKYELRMLRLYSVWYIIHTAVSIMRGYVYDAAYYIRHFIWPANGSVLWFLPATMFAVFAVYELNRLMSAKKVFTVSVITLIFGYCMSTLAPLFSANPACGALISNVNRAVGFQNGIFFGFPYIALSCMLAGKAETGTIKTNITGVALSFFCLAAESMLVVMKVHPELTFLWLSALPMTYFAFRLTLAIRLPESGIYTVLRKTSTLVYVLHTLIIYLLSAVFDAVGFSDFQNLLLFTGTCVISIAAAYALYRLSQHRAFGFIRFIM